MERLWSEAGSGRGLSRMDPGCKLFSRVALSLSVGVRIRTGLLMPPEFWKILPSSLPLLDLASAACVLVVWVIGRVIPPATLPTRRVEHPKVRLGSAGAAARRVLLDRPHGGIVTGAGVDPTAHSGRVPAEQREVEDPHGEEAWIGETWFNLDGTETPVALSVMRLLLSPDMRERELLLKLCSKFRLMQVTWNRLQYASL